MGPKRTYVLSIHDLDGNLVLEEVRTRRRARLNDLSELGGQIDRWRQGGPQDESEDPIAAENRPS